MKKRLFLLSFCLMLFLLTLCSSKIDVNNVSFKTKYISGEKVSGFINLTIEDEPLDIEISDNQNKMKFEDFLKKNAADFKCNPYDCQKGYKTSGDGSTQKNFDIIYLQDQYAGFKIYGNNTRVTGLFFNLSSNFGKSNIRPLEIKFFENISWTFRKFSNDYSQDALFGCYNSTNGVAGPLIATSTYCEKIRIPETNSIIAGVKLANPNDDDKQLQMVIYSKDTLSEQGSCTINNPRESSECKINAGLGDYFAEQDYFVCVRALRGQPTNYKIYESENARSCGYIFSDNMNESEIDYSIYAKYAIYANSSFLTTQDINFTRLSQIADDYIRKKYDRNCSEGCVLPIEIKGINQRLTISNVYLYYFEKGDKVENKIYSVETSKPKFSFKGILDLSLTNFVIENEGNYRIFIGSKKIIDQKIEIIPAPKIKGVYPTMPAAGIPINFTALVDFNGSRSNLTYTWKFDNQSEIKTNINYLVYKLEKVKNYTLKISVSSGENLTHTAEFKIHAQRPTEVLNITLEAKKKSLQRLINEISSQPFWYQEALKKILNITSHQKDLELIEQSLKKAKKDDDYLELLKIIYSLDIPLSLFVINDEEMPLITRPDEVKPEVIDSVSGGLKYEPDKYINKTLSWQTEKMDAMIKRKEIAVTKPSGEINIILIVYEVSLKSKYENKSYFVISRKISEINPSLESAGFKGVGNYSVLELEPNQEKKFNFYVIGSEPISFFGSPPLSHIIFEGDIGVCNYNYICEKDLGENSNNCRSDCKPAKKMVFYIVIVIIIGILVYSALQVWYKHNYESFLFPDKKEMYNLIMFVTNAKRNKMSDSQIYNMLVKQGWAKEKIRYAIRKANGKNIAMPEIIPFERIAAFFRRRKLKSGFATATQQQKIGKVNKYN